MTGSRFDRPAGDLGQRTAGTNRGVKFGPRAIFRASAANIALCHLLVMTLFFSPIALGFSIIYAETEQDWLRAHYHYLRTSIALMVIGLAVGGLMILAGVSLSSALMLAGLAVCAVTLMLVAARSAIGIFRAFLGLRLRNHNSYFL